MYVRRLFTLILVSFTLLQGCQKDSGKDADPAPAPAPPAPVANFTVTNGGCTGPCDVTFTNTTTNATTYSWNFGDNSVASTAASPTHTYTTAGTYTVTLTATGAGGTQTKSTTVTIAEAPYYIRYKVNGVAVDARVLTATRQTTPAPRKLTVRGTGLAGVNPIFRFQLEEPAVIGWSAGLHAEYHSASTDRFMEYTNAAGQVYSSMNSTTNSQTHFSAISYANNGDIIGTFYGTLKTTAGATVTITEGTFKLKFSN